MIKLNRKLEYALIALKHMSKKEATNAGTLTSAKEITLHYMVPFDVVSRVLQILNQHGIVKSTQGVQGGYHLLKNLDDVSLNDLIEMIEGPLQLVKCMGDDHECEIKSSCNIISPVQVLNHKIGDFYKTIKISDLV